LQAGKIRIYAGASGTVAEAIEQFKAGKLEAASSADVEGHW
jgi:predicted Fe-Mo cluster-binding NifX family protein